jgi:hypothetical protein
MKLLKWKAEDLELCKLLNLKKLIMFGLGVIG